MLREHPLQYKSPGPLKRKKFVGESVPQLPVSMRDQEHVSASIDSRPFLMIWCSVFLSPNKIKGEDSQKGNNHFDDP
jgi:hypothetical protein